MRFLRPVGACLAAGLFLAACGDNESAAVAPDPTPTPVGPVELVRGNAPDGIEIDTKGATSVVVRSVPFAPGFETGWHTHDGIEVAVVSKGEVTFRRKGACGPTVYKAGDVIRIPADEPHFARNDGAEAAHAITTTYLKPGAPDRAAADPAC